MLLTLPNFIISKIIPIPFFLPVQAITAHIFKFFIQKLDTWGFHNPGYNSLSSLP